MRQKINDLIRVQKSNHLKEKIHSMTNETRIEPQPKLVWLFLAWNFGWTWYHLRPRPAHQQPASRSLSAYLSKETRPARPHLEGLEPPNSCWYFGCSNQSLSAIHVSNSRRFQRDRSVALHALCCFGTPANRSRSVTALQKVQRKAQQRPPLPDGHDQPICLSSGR